jgi:hypothetical protein
MYDFAYRRPASLADAVNALKAASDGKLLAGGMTLIPTLKQRLASPSDLIDLAGIAELKGIKTAGDMLTVGALATHAEVAAAAAVKQAIPALAALGDAIGDPQVRHPARSADRSPTTTPPPTTRPPCWPWAPRYARTGARSRPTISSPACSRPRSTTARSSSRSTSRSRRRPAT